MMIIEYTVYHYQKLLKFARQYARLLWVSIN